MRSGLASDEEHDFKTQARISSGLEDFLACRFASNLLTCLVRMWTSGIAHEARGVKGICCWKKVDYESLPNILLNDCIIEYVRNLELICNRKL